MNDPPPAAEALKRALRWQEEIEKTGITRADIARREGLSRSRVTQIMHLLDLSREMKAELLTYEDRPEWTIREALRRTSGK